MNKIIIILLFISIGVFAQKKEETYIAPFIKKSNYLSYLFIPDSNTQASLFNIRYQYLYIPQDKPFRRGGTCFNFGINLARFFTKKIILGLSIDGRLFFNGRTKQHFSKEFINDFNNNYISEYSNYTDSLRGSVLRDGINGTNQTYVRGSFPWYYGITFSPFPQKWGGFLLEVKKGGSVYDFYGEYDAKTLDPHKENQAVGLTTNDNISVELSFKPYKFFTSKITRFLDINKPKDIFNFLIVSLYYERFSLVGSKFNGQDLNTMVDQKFITKYSNQNYFGVKLGLGLY